MGRTKRKLEEYWENLLAEYESYEMKGLKPPEELKEKLREWGIDPEEEREDELLYDYYRPPQM